MAEDQDSLFRETLKKLTDENLRLKQSLKQSARTQSLYEGAIKKVQVARRELRDSEEKFRKLSSAANDAIIFLNGDGNIAFWNDAAETIFGHSRQEALGRKLHMLLAPERFHAAFEKGFAVFCKTGEGEAVNRTNEFIGLRKNGEEFPMEVSLSAARLGGVWHGLGIVRDITERKQAEEKISRAYHDQRALDNILSISLPPLSLCEILDKALDAVLSTSAFALLKKGAIFLIGEDGISLDLMTQRELPLMRENCTRVAFDHCLCGQAAASNEIVFSGCFDGCHEGGRSFGQYCVPLNSDSCLVGLMNIYVPADHVRDADEESFLRLVAQTLGNVIRRKKDHEKLHYMAHNDDLTGLPNRALFFDRLQQVMVQSQRRREKFAVLFVDLDRFKAVNDSLGHDAGDALLRETSSRLRGCVRKMDTVARMGGDEFTIILHNVCLPENAGMIAQKVIDALAQPFMLGGEACRIGASIGIAVYPDDGEDLEALIKCADTAMYQAKQKGRNNFQFYALER
ncbi:MAG: diguanylate cyclase [Mariprofundaceae bacterium]